MVLGVPIAGEVGVLVAGAVGFLSSQTLNDGKDGFVVSDAEGATGTEIVLGVDNDQG